MANDTKELLLTIMQRYDIGKKPLSRRLGWGDTTVMRYLDGVEPNREFAARIQELAENPRIFADWSRYIQKSVSSRCTSTCIEKIILPRHITVNNHLYLSCIIFKVNVIYT